MKTGIVGYGGYIPQFRIKVEDIAKIWQQDADRIKKSLLVDEKSVADRDEDTITISVAAGKNALMRSGVKAEDIGALFIGSESHPYVVKPSGTVVAEALDIVPNVMVADFEFACKAGTAAMQCCNALVKAGEIKYGMAIGADTAQAKPGDILEYTAAAGGAAFVIGNNPIAIIEGTYSYTTDTPDFWRREGQIYPRHGARFTGKPAYFQHSISAVQGLLEKLKMNKNDFDYVIFHMPNGKFPKEACKIVGIDLNKLERSLIVKKIGNTYSGSSLLGLCNVLDIAKPSERILFTSFGSGAGSDSFSLRVTEKIEERRNKSHKIEKYIQRKRYIDYGTYVRLRKKLIV